jgi:hypothetical protein
MPLDKQSGSNSFSLILALIAPIQFLGAIALGKNPIHHKCSKHILLQHLFLREKVEDCSILRLCHSARMVDLTEAEVIDIPAALVDQTRQGVRR